MKSDRESERVGPYRLEKSLGQGGMGAVWSAWDERLNRKVALKRLRADVEISGLRERFLSEARAAAALKHPSIVHIYDIVEHKGDEWIVMELVEGATLGRLLRTEKRLPLPQALEIGRQIAEGLAEAHAHGILHRDLKSSNVMITPAGHAKLLDFGLAKRFLLEEETATAEKPISRPGCSSVPSTPCRRSRSRGMRSTLVPISFRSVPCSTSS